MAHTVTAAFGGVSYAVTFHSVEITTGWDSHSKRETFRAVCNDCTWRGQVCDTHGGAESTEVRHQDSIELAALGQAKAAGRARARREVRA
jgi:hypothetical protein